MLNHDADTAPAKERKLLRPDADDPLFLAKEGSQRRRPSFIYAVKPMHRARAEADMKRKYQLMIADAAIMPRH